MNTTEDTPRRKISNPRLHALDVALEAAGLAISVVEKVPPRLRALADQVVRSASSVPANLAHISRHLPAADEDLPAIVALLPATPPATCLEHASTASWSKSHTDRHLHALATKGGEKCGRAPGEAWGKGKVMT